MRTSIKILCAIVVISASLGPVESAIASITIDTELALESDHIYGNCRLIITTNEPYSHLNSNCNLDRNDITIFGHELSGYEIGYPRQTTMTKTWQLLWPNAPQGNYRYCSRFGIWWGIGDPDDVLRVQWGHYADPNQNIVTEGDATCETAALPGPTSASTLFLGCHQPGCALWRFQFSAPNAQKYRIQSSPYSSGPWSTWTVTSSNTYFPHLAQNPRYWRIRGENSFGVGPWKILYTTGQCGDGGPGGGGDLD